MFGAANSHDGGGDGVSCGDRHAKIRGDKQYAGPGRFCGETLDGMDPDHFLAQRLDDAPTPGRGAGAHGQRAKNLDPDRNNQGLAGDRSGSF